MKVLCATPAFGGILTVPYFQSFLKTVAACQQQDIQLGVYTLSNESLIPRARNTCAAEFLKQDWDKLLFIDADLSWEPEQALALIRSEEHLVGGSYPWKAFPLEVMFNPTDEHKQKYGGGRTQGAFLKFSEEANGLGEVAVKHLPTGFMCMTRSVLTELKDTYAAPYDYRGETHWEFFAAGVVGGQYLSEDWDFCEKAAAAGFQPYLNVNCVVTHHGNFAYDIHSLT